MSTLANLLPAPVKRWLGRLSSDHKKGLFGIGWSSLSQMIGLSIRFISTLILTRLLTPEAYGVIGTALIIVTTLEWLSDLGVFPALIRHAKGEESEYLNTGWLINISRGLLIGIFGAGLAWPLAHRFYDKPELFGVLAALAFRPFLVAMRSPAYPMLRRRLEYKSLCIDEVSMTIVGVAASIWLAWWLRSAWAIVGGTLAGAATTVVVSYFLAPCRPSLRWSREAAEGIRELSNQVFFNTLVMSLWLNLPQLLGLKFADEKEMGLYNVGANLAGVVEGLATRGMDVHYSLLSRLPNVEQKTEWHHKVSWRVALLAMPLLAVGAVLGPLLVRILYDQRYLSAGILFAILICRLMVRILGQVQFQYLMVRAQVHRATIAYVVALVVQLACLVPAISWYGVKGLAISALISTTALTLTQTLLLRQLTRREWLPVLVTLGWVAVGLAVVLATSHFFV